jgi:hypothetical protein
VLTGPSVCAAGPVEIEVPWDWASSFEPVTGAEAVPEWRSRGVLLSMADEPIDLALAAESTPEFRQVDLDGKYVFSVFERFALRIKDANAVVPLRFEKP